MPQLLRILLVAGDPEVIRKIGLGLQLDHPGLAQVEGADSLATARRRLGIGAYDLALVELALGNGNGLHMLSQLRDVAPRLPLVALAARDSDPDAAACLALGAHDRIALEAMDSHGLFDRLSNAVERARDGFPARQRSARTASSLAASGCLAWHYDHGDGEVWLAAADPSAWQLPGPECRESLDALRARIHPDDRELVLRQLEELVVGDDSWNFDVRLRVGGDAFRWFTLRGRCSFDDRGRLEHASGLLSDAQREQKRLRELEQNRRFLRAVFDSARTPQAVIDASAVITDCNAAWLMLDDPACHAGAAFAPGRKFIEKSSRPEAFGDLDAGELARGVKQVLGGVTDQFSCEYGDGGAYRAGDRRWRITVTPLLNPGIAGAVVSHEEMTTARRAESSLRADLEILKRDFRTIPGPVFSLAPEFAVRAANAAGLALGRAPVIGRDVLRVLPRIHADAVSDGLAAIAAGAPAAARDIRRPVEGRIMRWLLAAQLGEDGRNLGVLVQGIDVTDIAARETRRAPVPVATATATATATVAEEQDALLRAQADAERLRAALEAAAAHEEAGAHEHDELSEALAAEQAKHAGMAEALATEQAKHAGMAEALAAEQAKRASMAEALAAEHAERAKTAEALAAEQAERARVAEALAAEQAECARVAEALAAEQAECARMADALESEQAMHMQTAAALATAGLVPLQLRAELEQARQRLHARIDELVENAFAPLLEPPAPVEPEAAPAARNPIEVL
jgi:DNA-binding response OmpR family regulator